ncbi:MAG: rod shape-determining protein [Candidatus Liptonbacteria bacterium]|nr:rod shape-determining protein [Candidatus Liptonbacteria bacterium]
MALFGGFFKDIGIDLGTANSLIYLKGKGIVLSEPSVAAVNTKTNQILAIGEEAKKMLNRTPAHINVIRPLVGGVISDFEMTQEMLQHFMKRVSGRGVGSFRRGVLAIPDGLTEVERKSVEDATVNAGCAKVYLVESPIAAALGAHLPIEAPTATLIVDIGGGTTDIAVISMGGIVISKTLKIAGDRLNSDIIRFAHDEFHLVIGEPTAEFAKISAGSAIPLDEKLEVPIRGRDMSEGLPREVIIKNTHVRAAIHKSLRAIVDAVKESIEHTPPELAGDMLKQGIFVCGGGALLRGFDQLIEKETSVSTVSVDDPLTCVARGLGRIVDNFEAHRSLLDNPLKPPQINL